MNRVLRRVLAAGGRFRPRPAGSSQLRQVLFAAQGAMMASHLARVHACVCDLPELEPFGALPSRGEPVRGEYARARAMLRMPFVSDFRAHLQHWDMVIVADHGYFRDITSPGRQCTVYVGHHSTSKTLPGEPLPYPVGRRARGPQGRIRYTRVFEASDHVRDRMVRLDPSLEDVVVVVGRLEHDDLLALAARREEVRERLGIDSHETVVMVMGTWGESSLFRTMGPQLLEQAERLRGAYRFVFTTHAHEYRREAAGGRGWGERLLALRERGFIVREPWDDPSPYLVASDVIVTDHTSLAHSAALLRKPAVYAPFPRDRVWDGSVTWRYRAVSPLMDDPARLGERLRQVLERPPVRELEALSREVNSCPGEARRRIRAEVASLLARGLNA